VAQLLAVFDETGSGRAGALPAEKRAALFSDNAIFVTAFGHRVGGRDSLRAFWIRLYIDRHRDPVWLGARSLTLGVRHIQGAA
jgi:hypothetical protein